ncbi:YdhK family protein [Terribacillus saccharophilus]|uniref:DUF1541 domain-containing protein n=1 Tax=Terribacillus saccharophilus TaxID=361277 RepID=A0ABX4H2S6_9BACI|nr:YdhK family protein [Terribacillus saccharophilus]PAD37150.1 hypothetical protein CHH56_00750 [Terribacillus saccharophilus]PAD97394.1 hypothetical protein CHH50_01455 [Terribacillus saccharophilus]PAE01442.1 hypothetical protein CHH48_01445 [Terribacillus saccharophilus]
MKFKKIILSLLLVILVLGFAACSNGENNDMSSSNEGDSDSEMNHSSMNHSSSGDLPEGLQEKENPTYPVGNKVIIEADHMEGMKGAEATISGAYDTTAYVISYNPTTGGEKVANHKWVIQEELEGAETDTIESGTEVILNADHMEGMDGAKATIESAKKTTVYMVDFTPTTGGEEVKNHKWLIDDELSPAE